MNSEPVAVAEQAPANGEHCVPSEPKLAKCCKDVDESASSTTTDSRAGENAAEAPVHNSASVATSDKSSVIVCNGYSESHEASGDHQPPDQQQCADDNLNVNNVNTEPASTKAAAAATRVQDKTSSSVVPVDEGSMGESMTTESV